MTLATWKKEFYPKKPSKRMTKREAVEHSLTKWRGLTKANLKKHDVRIDFAGDVADDKNFLSISSSSCALCAKYQDFDSSLEQVCLQCPLYQLLGKRCDSGEDSPFAIWVHDVNPRPMIRALEKTLKMVTEEE